MANENETVEERRLREEKKAELLKEIFEELSAMGYGLETITPRKDK